ncbi:efflux RND transporter permease subunit [Igneacidithiobacillus siniensis]|uniref:efflux RND transporter permease subunit n=1 Tax=Acidithiobacillus TaxID=119977 RepID=UPI002010710D|nr:efflux RND transporter permease subunit [Acidithiobacillus sp. S30A2]
MSHRYLRFLWETRATLLLLVAILLAAGVYTLRGMPESVFPPVDFPKVAVLVHTQDLPVRVMLLEVTRPLEQAAKGEPGVTLVRSQTGNGLSKLHVYFNPQSNPEQAYLLLQARLSHIPLPPGAKMTVRLMTPNIYPLLEYALVSQHLDSSAMMPTFAFTLRPALLSLPGVYHVNATGRGWPEVQVLLHPRRLAQYHLPAAAVIAALQMQQGPFFSGVLNAFHQQFILATTPRPQSPAALGQLTLPIGPANAQGVRAPLPLSAVATIQTGPPPLIRQAAVPGWQHALIVDVAAQQGANQVQVAAAVTQAMTYLRQQLPPGVHLVKIFDLSRLIRSSLSDVWSALALGAFLAFLVVLAFLGRWDAALATLTVVPLALAATLLVLHALGFGIDIMTLGGITAALGALVDHAIVIVERGLHGLHEDDAEQRRERALQRIRALLPLMTLATLTACVVFLPLIFLSGTVGLLFRSMALAIVIALATSQLIAMTITPVFALWLAGRARRPHRLWGERALRRHYSRALVFGMRRPLLALPLLLLLLLLGGVGVATLPTAFLPHWDEGLFVVPFRTPTGSTVSETTRTGRELMAIARKNPNVARVSLVVGRGLGNAYATPNKGGITIVLKRQHRASTAQVMQELRVAFRRAVPNLTTLETQQIMINRLGNLSGSHAPLVIQLFGSEPRTLHQIGLKLTHALNASQQFTSIVLKSPSAGPEIEVQPNAISSIAGLSPQTLAEDLKSRFWGVQAGFLLHGEQILPIRVTVQQASTTPQSLGQTSIWLPNGQQVPLTQAAKLYLEGAIPYVTHQNLVPDAEIKLHPRAGDGLTTAAARAQAIIQQVGLPLGVTSHLVGYYQEQQRSFAQMSLILAAALLILLVLLGLQFSSQRAALAALLAVASAAPGALLLLLLSGTDLDSTAFLGVLLVFAIAVNNVILLFARARQLGGAAPRLDHVAFAARQRLRPILMTMVADVLGFLPLAIGVGRGTDLLQPLALAVMGGLLLATLTTLWLAPVLYSAFQLRFSPPLRTR